MDHSSLYINIDYIYNTFLHHLTNSHNSTRLLLEELWLGCIMETNFLITLWKTIVWGRGASIVLKIANSFMTLSF